MHDTALTHLARVGAVEGHCLATARAARARRWRLATEGGELGHRQLAHPGQRHGLLLAVRDWQRLDIASARLAAEATTSAMNAAVLATAVVR